MSDFNDSNSGSRTDHQSAARRNRTSLPEMASRRATSPRALMAVPRRIGGGVSHDRSTGILTKSASSTVGRVQSAAGIPVHLNLNHDPKRTAEWLRRVLAEARAQRSAMDLGGVVRS